MHIESDVLATLLRMQQLDVQARRTEKELEALPQRKAILEARAKRRKIQEKDDQVSALLARADEKLAKLTAEDDDLAQKQAKIQAEIDDVKGDFRSVQARTKELSGLSRRRETLEGEMSAADAEITKINAVKSQIALALGELDAQESAATEVFVAEGGKLKGQAAAIRAEREQMAQTVSADVLDIFDRTAKSTGGVPLSLLAEGETCGACRGAIDHGRIVDMRGRGNIGACPNCGRLLVLDPR